MAQQEYMAGMLRVLILNELSGAPGYGYGIARSIDARSGGDLVVRPESLYPVLHRMEQEGLLKAEWTTVAARSEGTVERPRKMYSLTPKGRKRWDRARESFVKQSRGALKAMGLEAAGEPA
jgi:PadR family transcriptional regulator PadR